MTPDGRAETLEEAWDKVRRTCGDDVAQEAMFRTLSRGRIDINEVAYFMTEVRWLRVERYHDGVELKKEDGQLYRMHTALDWQEVVDPRTPEDIAISREQLRTANPVLVDAVVHDKYVPKAHLKCMRAGLTPPSREEMDCKHRDAARESARRCSQRRKDAAKAGIV